MDEAEKYQQRLQAIAEKRRLQEEQDRTKRQQEDEKLRLQQLKRKSLRDQWLMEGSPLSPESIEPPSPLWASHTQQTEAHSHRFQSEIIEKPQKHKEDASMSTQSHSKQHSNNERMTTETPPPSETSAEAKKNSHDPSLTHGTAPDQKSHNASHYHVNDIDKGVETLMFLGYMEAEPGQGLGDDSDISAGICAERVIIMEGEELSKESHNIQAKKEEAEEEMEEQVEEREKEEAKRENGQEDKEERKEEQVENGDKEQELQLEEEQKEKPEEERDEKPEDELEEEHTSEVENHCDMSPEAGGVRDLEESLRDNHRELKTEDTKLETVTYTGEETHGNTDSKPTNDMATKSALNTESTPDTDQAAGTEQERAATEPHPPSSSETSEDALQTLCDSIILPASALNTDRAPKSPGPAATSANTAEPFQEIPLGGALVEEEPLLATKVELLTNPNQADGAKTKTCKCCSLM